MSSVSTKTLGIAALGGALVTMLVRWSPSEEPPVFRLGPVTVVNPGVDRRPGATLLIREGRVAELRRVTDTPAAGERFVLPGFVDMHVHVPEGGIERVALAFLRHGVTTIRDLGDTEGTILDLRDRIASGEMVAPRLFACGPIVDGSPPAWSGSRIARSAGEARKIVRELADARVDCIKAYRQLEPAVATALHDEALRYGLTVAGHVPGGLPFEAARLDDVQHLTGVAGATDAAESFTAHLEQVIARWEALDDERVDAVIRASIERDVAHTPTLVFWERLFRLPADRELFEKASLAPDWHRDGYWEPEKPWNQSSEDRRRLARVLARMKAIVGRLHEAGVRIHAGTDALNPFVVPGASLWEELRHLVEAGLSAEAALASATVHAADSLGAPELGIVRHGSRADLLLFRRDPTRDLDNLDSLEAVIVDGRIFSVDDLDAELEDGSDTISDLLRSAWIAACDTLEICSRTL